MLQYNELTFSLLVSSALPVAAFVSTVAYLEKYRSNTSGFQLLPVGAETLHPTKGPVLGYYSDIVVHRDVRSVCFSVFFRVRIWKLSKSL